MHNEFEQFRKYEIPGELELGSLFNEDGSINEETYRLLFHEDAIAEAKKNIKLKHMPYVLKRKIILYLSAAIAFTLLSIANTIFYLMVEDAVNSVPFFLFFASIFWFVTWGVYYSAKLKTYQVFQGIVVSIKKKSSLVNFFGKDKAYNVITLSDGERFLSFKYPNTRKRKVIEKGDALSLYLMDNAQINFNEMGPIVDEYFGVEFSATSDEVREKINAKGGKLTYDEYLKISATPEEEEIDETILIEGNMPLKITDAKGEVHYIESSPVGITLDDIKGLKKMVDVIGIETKDNEKR